MKFRQRLLLALLLICSALFIISCGRKGDPTLKTFEKPIPVKEIRAVHREDELAISWSYPASERAKIKGFYIEKAEIKSQESGVQSPEFKNITFLKNDISQFVDKDFKTKQEYFYRIRVYSLRDIISDESPILKIKPLPLPDRPTGLKYSVTKDSVVIKWDWVCAEFKYNIYKSYEKGKYPASPLNNIPLTATSFSDKVEKDKPAYYTLRALLDTNIKDEGYLSEELEVNPETFIPSQPHNLKYVPSEKKVYLMWDENPEVWIKGYRIYRKKGMETEFTLIGESTLPAFTDNEPLSSKRSYFITAVGPGKEGTPSETVEVHPLPER
ncbi:MAG: fibronectin type III domain-containing protein [Nitrospirota bacterium]